MRKVIIGILMFFCLLGVYQSLWANHSMHPLKQIAFVKKMIDYQLFYKKMGTPKKVLEEYITYMNQCLLEYTNRK